MLVFVAYYLGFRSGGPVRIIASFVDHLADELDIRIVTRDQNSSDPEHYPEIETGGVETDSGNCIYVV